MPTHAAVAPPMFKTATLMCVLWLGATMMLLQQVQESEMIRNWTIATHGKSLSFLEIHSYAHPRYRSVQ